MNKDYVNESNFPEFRQAVKQAATMGQSEVTFNGKCQSIGQAMSVVSFLSNWYQRWDDQNNPRKGNEYYATWKEQQKIKATQNLDEKVLGGGSPHRECVAEKGGEDVKETNNIKRQSKSRTKLQCKVPTNGSSKKARGRSKGKSNRS